MVSGAVVVSSQTTSVRAANLLASFIIIPMALLIQGESIIMFWARYNVLWWAIIGQLLIAGLLLRTGIAHFNREELLGRELDTLNLRWSWRTFKSAFWGQSRSLVGWYQNELADTLRSMAIPIGMIALAFAAAVWIGAGQARLFVLPAELLDWRQLDQGFLQGLEGIQFFSVAGVGTVWLHNLRVVALATVLGIFSFGVLAVIVLMLPFIIIGYFMANMANVGLNPIVFITALVLPHGILEIPAIILAGAAILHLGATFAAPAHGQAIGEAWLRSLADWAKVMLGLVLPLLLGAALLEVLLTPRLAVWILGS
jgi:uncharacterized membrane protein SpoIIM required for sporulation